MQSAPRAVEMAISHTLREDRGRILAALVAQFRDFELAEDCLQDAAEAALKAWPRAGVPASRRGWLLQVARRRAIDRLRRARIFAAKAGEIALLTGPGAEMAAGTGAEMAAWAGGGGPHEIPDHRLRLIFACCHPAIGRKSRIALTLRTLGGLSTEEVARAFLDKPATMAQRLSRARAKISKAGLGFAIPEGAELVARRDAVLKVIYLIYNEGHAQGGRDAQGGGSGPGPDLCREAIHLARLMHDLSPGEPEAAGLLALLLLTQARAPALYAGGRYVPLEEQDRGRWNGAMIREGLALIAAALGAGRAGPFQIEAAIAALHCEARTAAATDWPQIAALYRILEAMLPSATVRLNSAVALARTGGRRAREAALARIDALEGALAAYQPFHAARADLLRRLGRREEGRTAYARALALTRGEKERAFLRRRMDSL